MLCGFDYDLAGRITAASNRIRSLLTQIHPALERVLGPASAAPRHWTCCSTPLTRCAPGAGDEYRGWVTGS